MSRGGKLVRIDALQTQPWKNGGGMTAEIASDPPGAGWQDFNWRVSRASIDKDGAFSVFPGMLRWILLLEGNGFTLSFADRAKLHLSERFALEAFPGDAIAHCQLSAGPCTVLNVVARPELPVRVSVARSLAPVPSLGHALVAAAGISIRLDDRSVLNVALGLG